MLLRRELERVRQVGYAVAQEEYEAELSAVGAVVRDDRGDAVASITVSGPSYRLPAQRLQGLGESVRMTADRISAQLGHRPARSLASPAPRTSGGAGALTTRPSLAATSRISAGAAVERTTGNQDIRQRPQTGVAGPVFGD
jgi:hypothetical protein